MKAEQGQILFEEQAAEVVQALREAFLGLITSLPGQVRRPADLERTLGLSRTLAWQVHRMATSPDAFKAASQMPGTAAVRQVIGAADAVGVPQDRLAAVTDAMERFRALGASHAGERAALSSMLKSVAGHESEGIDLALRRRALRVNSQCWGYQVKTFVGCGLYHPSDVPGHFDMIAVRGLHEIRRLRSGARFRFGIQRMADGNATHGDRATGRADAPPRPKLLTQFCTKPCPELISHVEGDFVHTYLRDAPLGKAGLQSIYVSDATRGRTSQSGQGEPNRLLNFAGILKPIEVLLLDVLIHRDLYGPLDPTMHVYGLLDRVPEVNVPASYGPNDEVPITAEVFRLGVGPGVLPTPHLPRYRQMIEEVCRDAGWDVREFDVYRCTLECPLLNTGVCMSFELPDEHQTEQQ